MRNFLRKKLSVLTMAAVLAQFVQFFGLGAFTVQAATQGDVVINEVAWAGTADNSNDEWIELYNSTTQAISLNGWYIEDDGVAMAAFGDLSIPAHGYFLIEDSEETISTVKADLLLGLSLANAGDSLILKDNTGKIIDQVVAGGGAWYAGSATDKSTMERIDPNNKVDSAENWANAASGNGAKGRTNLAIIGTPKSANSTYGGGGVEVYLEPKEFAAKSGDFIDVPVFVSSAADLYAYGFEISYSPTLLSFVSGTEADFLQSGGATTAFNIALKDDQEGTLVIGNARLVNPAKGVDGSGKLINLKFKVLNGTSGGINFTANSFLSNSEGNFPASFKGGEVKIGEAAPAVGPVTSLKVENGEAAYKLKVSWQTNGADSYIVKRKSPKGEFVTLGEVNTPYFVDENNVVTGVSYAYQVVAVKNNVTSSVVEITGSETRGLKGDNDRNKQIDGRDLENLARSFGSEFGDEEYKSLADTNYDGIVDGKDLIDLGVNFGLTYSN
ncbi:MAG: lamin tail domain-containing protein [Patescibacteria group bacterium]